MTDTRRYTIDPPPSANKLFRNATPKDNVRGRIKTKKYHDWRNLVVHQLRLQKRGLPTLTGPVAVSITRRRHHPLLDLSNGIKPVEDALQAAGIIENDRQVTLICASWGDHSDCIVTVSPDVGAAA